MRPGRKFTKLARLSVEFGWKHNDVVKRLEEKRLTRAAAWFEKKKAVDSVIAKAKKVSLLHANCSSNANADTLLHFYYCLGQHGADFGRIWLLNVLRLKI